jgi:hypothetical protein
VGLQSAVPASVFSAIQAKIASITG